MINLKEDATSDYGELLNRQNKILGNMLGAEIDFLIKGIDNKSRSVAASRKDAMLKKRQIFYLPDANGTSRVCEGRIVHCCRRKKLSVLRSLVWNTQSLLGISPTTGWGMPQKTTM